MKRALLILVAMSLLPATGCATLRNLAAQAFQKPTLTFESARVRQISLGSATVDFTYRLHNPNDVGVTLSQVDYALAIEGKTVVTGRPPNGFHMAANGSTEVVFPATVHFASLAPTVKALLSKKIAHYRASGHIGIDTPIGQVTLPVSHAGTFGLPSLPNVHFDSPKVTEVSFTHATLEIPVSFTNPNGLPLPIQNLQGALTLGGRSAGTVSTGAITLKAKGVTQVNIPIRLDLVQLASSASAVLHGGSVRLGFQGGLHSGGASVPLQLLQQVMVRH